MHLSEIWHSKKNDCRLSRTQVNRNNVEDEVNTDYEIWTLATLASCSLVLNEKELSDKYERSFLSRADKMMKTSYLSQKQKLVELLKS